MKRAGAVLLTVAAAGSLTGCITFLTQINVRGDGSGTMVQTITMNLGQIKESVEGAAKQLGATITEPKEDTKNKPAAEPEDQPMEEDLKGKAVDMGQGVTFVSAEKIDTKTASGVRVTYVFKDINQLSVNPKPEAAIGTAGAGASSPDALKFRFKRLPNGNADLTVVLPGPKPEAPKEQTVTPPAASEVEPDMDMSMLVMQMFKGLDMGQGVTFVSAEKIDTKTAAGVRVIYAFKDINLLAVNPKPAAAMGTAGAGASSQDALKFRFNRLPNDNAVLTVVLPEPKAEAPKEQTATPPPAAEPAEPDMDMSMMIMQMFKGLHMGVAVNVEGKVVKTNSPYVEGSKVTLMDIDFDPLLSDAKGFKSLNEKMETAMGDDRKMMEILKGIKGLMITTDPEVSIEFTPDEKP